jgi:hypothetical protein
VSPEPLKWFKLLLQEQKKITPAISQIPATSFVFQVHHNQSPERFTTPADVTALKLRLLGITPLMAVTDFLANVREVAVAEIGNSYQTQWVQGQKIEYVLTIPGKRNCPSYR